MALDFSWALSLMIVITLSLQVSVIASLRHRFEQHIQALSLGYVNGVNLAITLPSLRVIFFTAKYSKEPCYFRVIVQRFVPNVVKDFLYPLNQFKLNLMTSAAFRKTGVIASYSYRFVLLSLWLHMYPLSLSTFIATGKFVVLWLL
jgi:hypothetical protein